MIRCTKEKDIIVFLKKEYDGKLELEASSKCMYINGKTGAIAEESQHNFLIVRKDCKMKFYSTKHYNTKTTVSWQLDFSTFKAFFPRSNQELNRAPIHVFHAVNEGAFYKFCTNFKLKEVSNISLLEDLKWKRSQSIESRINLLGEFIGDSKMQFGEFQQLTVAVEKLKSKGDFWKHVSKLRNLGVHDNILGFLKAETNGIHDTFAYQYTFAMTMKEYVHSISLFNLPTRTSPQWIKVIRGMINGLRFLHIHEIRHGKLKLHNVFIKDNYVAQLAGLANTDWPDEEKVSMDEFLRLDIYDWGKILLNIMTHGHHGGDDTWDPDSVPQILEELREEDEEVRDLLSKILQKDYNLRRVGHPVIEHLDNIVGPEVFVTSWKGKFDDDVLEEVTRQ
ncbi:putative ribonuclease H-like domain-containing protein, partial [Tanacetum coccineum]